MSAFFNMSLNALYILRFETGVPAADANTKGEEPLFFSLRR